MLGEGLLSLDSLLAFVTGDCLLRKAGAGALPPFGQRHSSQRLIRPVLQVLNRLIDDEDAVGASGVVARALPAELVALLIEVASDRSRNMHDLVAAVRVLLRAAGAESAAASHWVCAVGAGHEYPRIREMCVASAAAPTLQ